VFKTIIAIVIAGAIIAPARAMTQQQATSTKFVDLQDYSLTCEETNGNRYTLDVRPSISVVTLTSDKGTFDFPITGSTIAPQYGSNEFGNPTWSIRIYNVQFKDNGGNIRNLVNTSTEPWTLYIGKSSKGNFMVHCL
jgi:hypothetical protein